MRVFLGPRHPQLAVDHRERQPPLDQVERVAAELVVAPAFEDRQPVALPGGQRFQLLRPRQQPRRDVDVARPDLEQQLEQVGDQRAVLAEPRLAVVARRHFVGGHRLGVVERRHQPRADIVARPGRRQPAHARQIALLLGRMAGEIGQRLVLDDAAARQILAPRLHLAPPRQRLQPPEHVGLAARRSARASTPGRDRWRNWRDRRAAPFPGRATRRARSCFSSLEHLGEDLRRDA